MSNCTICLIQRYTLPESIETFETYSNMWAGWKVFNVHLNDKRITKLSCNRAIVYLRTHPCFNRFMANQLLMCLQRLPLYDPFSLQQTLSVNLLYRLGPQLSTSISSGRHVLNMAPMVVMHLHLRFNWISVKDRKENEYRLTRLLFTSWYLCISLVPE